MYGYLKKPVKTQVDTIVDELARLPEVAECYEQWNRMRDELERYYKDTPREHKPLSQQQEFKAIKNMVIHEAEELRLGTFTFEDMTMKDEVNEDQEEVYYSTLEWYASCRKPRSSTSSAIVPTQTTPPAIGNWDGISGKWMPN